MKYNSVISEEKEAKIEATQTKILYAAQNDITFDNFLKENAPKVTGEDLTKLKAETDTQYQLLQDNLKKYKNYPGMRTGEITLAALRRTAGTVVGGIGSAAGAIVWSIGKISAPIINFIPGMMRAPNKGTEQVNHISYYGQKLTSKGFKLMKESFTEEIYPATAKIAHNIAKKIHERT